MSEPSKLMFTMNIPPEEVGRILGELLALFSTMLYRRVEPNRPAHERVALVREQVAGLLSAIARQPEHHAELMRFFDEIGAPFILGTNSLRSVP
jgi:hypothetical protein